MKAALKYRRMWDGSEPKQTRPTILVTGRPHFPIEEEKKISVFVNENSLCRSEEKFKANWFH